MGCNYLSLPEITASGNKIHKYAFIYPGTHYTHSLCTHNWNLWKISLFQFWFSSSYHVTILHLSQQVNHRGKCNTETCSDHCFSWKSIFDFTWFGSRAHNHFVKWVWRNIFCSGIYGQFSSAKFLHILQPRSPTIYLTLSTAWLWK